VSTDDAGLYQFPTLPPGAYTLTIQARGFHAYRQTGVTIAANAATRVDATLEIGAMAEQVTVEASVAALQTEGAEVRRDMSQTTLENAPIPLGRNYQSLLVTLPGLSPPQDSGSFPANPSRSLQFSANGASIQVNNIRIDGASSYNPNIAENTAVNPTLDAIEAVDVVTSSFGAEEGFAGGAAVFLQMKSGTNALHGSAFWYHTDQHLMAYPFFSDRTQAKPLFIYHQPGFTIGGPIRKNRVFYFVSYERAGNRQNAQSFLSVPTAQMRQGDMSRSPVPVYDPFSGNAFDPACPTAFAADRTPFPGNQIPQSRFAGPTQRMLAISSWHLPNYPGTGALGLANNYLASVPYWTRRDQTDTKINYNLTKKWTVFQRLSGLWFDQLNPPAFGSLGGPNVQSTNSRPGPAYGSTYSATVSTTYVASPTFVVDAWFGYTLQEINAEQIGADQNFAQDVLGIPGTNGTSRFSGGMAHISINGFSALGYPQTSPFISNDALHQYAANGNWTHGSHNVRFGVETLRFGLNEAVANPAGGFGGPMGGFQFVPDTTSLRGGPATNNYNSFASFLLGVAQQAGRNVLTIPRLLVNTSDYGVYAGDRWQLSPRLTLSYGVRWEYYPFPSRPDRGLERYDFNTNEMLVCGVGSIPRDCGNSQSKRLFTPRLGIAWRPTGTLVVRAGYGLAFDPYNIGRDLRANYPVQFAQNLSFPDSRAWATTLDQGLPSIPPPLQGARVPMPVTATLLSADQNFHRGYVESWNFTVEKQIGSWLASTGYVASRSIRQTSFLNANYASLGAGQQGEPLFQKFGRAATTQIMGDIGAGKYDSLQAHVERRFRGYAVALAYTWAHSLGYTNSQPYPRSGTRITVRHNTTSATISRALVWWNYRSATANVGRLQATRRGFWEDGSSTLWPLSTRVFRLRPRPMGQCLMLQAAVISRTVSGPCGRSALRICGGTLPVWPTPTRSIRARPGSAPAAPVCCVVPG
jgi:hypothetical protein